MEVVCICSHELGVGFGLSGIKNMLTENVDEAVRRINESREIGLVFLSEDFRHLQEKLKKPTLVIKDVQ